MFVQVNKTLLFLTSGYIDLAYDIFILLPRCIECRAV